MISLLPKKSVVWLLLAVLMAAWMFITVAFSEISIHDRFDHDGQVSETNKNGQEIDCSPERSSNTTRRRPRANILSDEVVIVLAGLTRSASTWEYSFVYNFCKLRKIPFLAFTSERLRVWPDEDVLGKTLLIKSHHYDTKLHRLADFILTSHRDLRDVLSSYVRKNFYECTDTRDPNHEMCIELLETYFQHYLKWAHVASVDIQYEFWFSNRLEAARKVLESIGVTKLDDTDLDSLMKDSDMVFKQDGNKSASFWFVDNQHHSENDAPGLYNRFLHPGIVDCVNYLYWDWLKASGYDVPLEKPQPPMWCARLQTKIMKRRAKRFSHEYN